MEGQEEYYCNCEQICKGTQRKLSKAAYFRHRPYRDSVSNYSPSMQAFLNKHPVVVHTTSSRAAQSSRMREAEPPDRDTDHTSGPLRKRARQSGDDAVGVIFLGIYQTMLTDLLRAIHPLVLVQVHLYSPMHGKAITRVMTLILGRMFLNHLATSDLLEVQKTLSPTIVRLTILPIEIQVRLICLLATLKICGYRIQSILTIS